MWGGGEKSLGLSSGSKSVGGVGGSMGPSGSRRGGFVDIGSKAHCLQKGPSPRHLQNTSELRRQALACPTQSTAALPPLLLLAQTWFGGGPASRIESHPPPEAPTPTQLRVRRTAEMWTVRRARRHKARKFLMERTQDVRTDRE